MESLEFVKIPQKSATACEEEEAIFSYLDLKKQHHDILLRARDLEKLVHGAKYEIVNLRQMAEVLNTSQLEEIFKTVESNTKILADSSIVVKKSGSSLELVQLLLAGSFAFTLLDRIPGGSLNIEVPQWVDDVFTKGIIDVPFLFFALNLAWMAICVRVVFAYKHKKIHSDEFGRHMLRVKVNKAIKVDEFEVFLATKMLEKQESVSQPASELRRVMWRDVSGGSSSHNRSHVNTKKKGILKKQRVSKKQQVKQFVHSLWWRLCGQASGATPMGNSVSPSSLPANGGAGGGVSGGTGAGATMLDDGVPVEIEVEYDSRYGYLLFVSFQFHARKKKQPSVIKATTVAMITWLKGLANPQPAAKKSLAKKQLADKHQKQLQDEMLASMDATAKLEEELMTWFAAELKIHKAISNVSVFLGAVSGDQQQ